MQQSSSNNETVMRNLEDRRIDVTGNIDRHVRSMLGQFCTPQAVGNDTLETGLLWDG